MMTSHENQEFQQKKLSKLKKHNAMSDIGQRAK